MKCQECRGAEGDGDLVDASRAEEQRPQSAQEPIAHRQPWRPPAATTKDDQLLLEHEILRDHRSHATGTTQLRSRHSEVEQGEEDVFHARVSVGHTCGPQKLDPAEISAT